MEKSAELAIASKYVRVSDSEDSDLLQSKLWIPKVYPFWDFHNNSIYEGDIELAKVLDFTNDLAYQDKSNPQPLQEPY